MSLPDRDLSTLMPARPLLVAALAALILTGVVLGLAARLLPRPRQRPLWVGMALLAGAAVALIVVLALPRGPERLLVINEGMPNPIARTPESVATGEAIYRARCQVCHGVSGGGNGPGAAGLDPPVSDFRVHLIAGHSDGRFFHWISEGIPGTAMPAFKDRLRVEERWHVINFMRHAFTPAER